MIYSIYYSRLWREIDQVSLILQSPGPTLRKFRLALDTLADSASNERNQELS